MIIYIYIYIHNIQDKCRLVLLPEFNISEFIFYILEFKFDFNRYRNQ